MVTALNLVLSSIFWNRYVNKVRVSRKMVAGTVVTTIGTVVSVLFGSGPGGSPCYSPAEIAGMWNPMLNFGWWIYLAVTTPIAVLALLSRLQYNRQARAGKAHPGAERMQPVVYSLYAALFGGAQMIVHSKCVSLLLSLLGSAAVEIFTGWLVYVELLFLATTGAFWMFKLTECLGLFNPLLILPLMTGTYILFGGIAGGIFFGEFSKLHLGMAGIASWPLYLAGLGAVVGGLLMIATAPVSGAVQPSAISSDDGAAASATAINVNDAGAVISADKSAIGPSPGSVRVRPMPLQPIGWDPTPFQGALQRVEGAGGECSCPSAPAYLRWSIRLLLALLLACSPTLLPMPRPTDAPKL